MRISFIGSSLVSAYWNGAATYYRGIIRELYRRGHSIVFYESDIYDRQKYRDIPDPDYARIAIYPAIETGAQWALNQARGSDIVVKASGVGIFDEWWEREVLELQSPMTRVIYWDVDAPATLDRMEANPGDPFRKLLPWYDLVLTYGGGDPVVKKYLSFGARRCVPVYNGVDPDVHAPSPPDPRFLCDLGFMGNRLPDREGRVHEFFTKPAQLLGSKRFIIGGNGWQQQEFPQNITCLGHVYTRDHNAFNSTPTAVLNVCRESMARYGHSPATRVFEAAGAGACIITDQWEGLDEFFEPGKEWLSAKDGEQVADLIDSLDPEHARKIGEAARRRVLACHTYDERASLVETLLTGML